MVRRAYQQRSLIEVLLPDADKLWDPTLRRIDALGPCRSRGRGPRAAPSAESVPRSPGNAGRRRAADAHPQASVRLEL
jgi:hypothetical protein